jgi:RNA polymerase sigma factor (sigma-70 family)
LANVRELSSTETDHFQEMTEVVRRVVAARISDRDTADDIVQETLARVLEAKKPLVGQAKLAYAIVVARNLVADMARHNDRWLRNRHRLIDLRPADQPDEEVIRGEERQALETALRHVAEADRHVFIAHEALEVDTARLARQTNSSPAGVATKLARTRAKLRVEYLLALRGVELPTTKCKRVLVALSSGDARRQRALDSGRHLLGCATCASLSPALLERRKALAAFLPIAGLAKFPVAFKSWLGTAAGKTVGATVVVGAGAAVVIANLGGNAPSPPERAHILTVSGKDAVVPGVSGGLDQYVGERVRADDATVRRVPVDEGFWVVSGPESVLWVRLQGSGESKIDIDEGDTVDFTGVLRRNPSSFAAAQGLAGADADRLRSHGYHITVAADEIRIEDQQK